MVPLSVNNICKRLAICLYYFKKMEIYHYKTFIQHNLLTLYSHIILIIYITNKVPSTISLLNTLVFLTKAVISSFVEQ